MPGVKGAGGRPPKPESRRRRTNKLALAAVTAPGEAASAPPPDEAWHQVARMWFDSLAQSGQAVYYQASDWATAWLVAESMSRELSPQPMVVGRGQDAHVEMHEQPPSAAAITAWLKASTALMTTEGDRRRMRLELERPATGDPNEADGVSVLDRYRARLQGPPGRPPA